MTRQLLTEVDITDRVITLDALHSTFESVELILKAKADYLLTLNDKTALQLDKVKSLPWRSIRVQRHSEALTKAHGRLEQRHIEVLEVGDPQRFDFKQVRQAFRITWDREVLKATDGASTEIAYGITSVGQNGPMLNSFCAGVEAIGQSKTTTTIFATAPSKRMPVWLAPATVRANVPCVTTLRWR